MRSHYRRDIGGIKSLAFSLIAALVKGLTRITFYDKAWVRIPYAVLLLTRNGNKLAVMREEGPSTLMMFGSHLVRIGAIV